MDVDKQMRMYKNNKCYMCEGTLTFMKEKNRKQCHTCLGHFEMIGNFPCFVSWVIEVEKKNKK